MARIALGAAGVALLAVALPLPIYAISLGALGMVHVLAELRYVDVRFLARLPRTLVRIWLVLLGAIVAARVAVLTGTLGSVIGAVLELVLVVLLALSVLPLAREQPRAGAMGFLAVGMVTLLLLGSAQAPFETLVVLAFLHNLTPVGFLAEKLAHKARQRAMTASLFLFGLVPALIISGLPRRALAALGWDGTNLGLPGIGGPSDHLGAFVPTWISGVRAIDLFCAAVFLQCLHYAVVILVLPRFLPNSGTRGLVRWPRPSRFRMLLAVASAVSLCLFALSFSDARGLYGVFAAVHAWIEIPVLLAALATVAPRVAIEAS